MHLTGRSGLSTLDGVCLVSVKEGGSEGGKKQGLRHSTKQAAGTDSVTGLFGSHISGKIMEKKNIQSKGKKGLGWGGGISPPYTKQ